MAALQSAANQGNAEAQDRLAQAYLLGDLGLETDYAEAARWAQKSADQGNGDAEALLAGLYIDGLGVPKDEQKAIPLLDSAMGKKSGVAFYLGARLARERTAVPDHDLRANLLLRIGAYLGNISSMAALGQVFELGRGVKSDPVQAYAWYGVAVFQDKTADLPPDLVKAFGALAQAMTPAQEKAAKAIALRCVNSGLKDCGAPQLPKELVQ